MAWALPCNNTHTQHMTEFYQDAVVVHKVRYAAMKARGIS